ncbi:MAG: dTDP-glucose 4,6-dehydratase [Candidatus Limnocylindrales bacterium]
MRLLVTGGAGFIGSAFVRRRLAMTSDDIVVLDKLTYAGNRANLAPCESDPRLATRLRFVTGDICDEIVVDSLVQDVDAVVNFAAESHVDRSILDAEAFLTTGVIGVHVLVDAVRRQSARRPVRFLQVSTDEVYGAVEDGFSVETDPIAPRSPYAAAKAAGELLARTYYVTHETDVVITRGANTYGPYQHPEKVIPLFVTNALEDQFLPLYGDGRQQRDWLHVNDHADAVGFVLDHGDPGEIYNVRGMGLRRNRDITANILELLNKPWTLTRSVPDRPGHDLRYAMDGSKLAQLGWQPSIRFEDGLADTVQWYAANQDWWRHAKSGDWSAYYEHQYGRRLAESVEA